MPTAAVATQGQPATLYTIPFSHFCEAARWALALAKLNFREAPYLPGVHMFFSPMARLRRKGQAPLDFTGDASTTPLLVGPGGEVLAYDSWACVGLYGSCAPTGRVKELLDTVVGPATRTITYSHLLTSEEGDAVLLKLCSDPEVPWWQRFLFHRRPFRQQVKAQMYKSMVRSPEHVESVRCKLREALVELEPLLDEPPYAGSPPTAAGIALASLMAPVIMPPAYCSSFYRTEPAPLSEVPPAMQREVAAWRQTTVGAWALAFYAQHREQDTAT